MMFFSDGGIISLSLQMNVFSVNFRALRASYDNGVYQEYPVSKVHMVLNGGLMRFHGVVWHATVALVAAASLSAFAQTSVPYVGCPGEGQTGPYSAAKGSQKPVNLSPEIANKLAWYEYKSDAGQFGTLGPRGWNCFVTIGSDGETLYVAPETLDSAKIIEHKDWKGFTGPVIQLSGWDGGTSGRFEVARTVARVFPAYHNYARKIIAEGFGPTSDYPFGPFPSDHLTYKSKKLVEFTTPGHHKGLGTMSWLLPSDQPITGFALLADTPDLDTGLLQLSVRLPLSLSFLSATLIQQAEPDDSR